MGHRQRALEGVVTMDMLSFYKGKRVLVTGHTGFKGTWLCAMLLEAGAQVTGYALAPPTDPSVFALSGIEKDMRSVIGDIRDLKALQKTFEEAKPEVVFHLAAQPLVRESYQQPVYTYETNVMGTVHVLECARNTPGVISVLNVTTDKVYENKEWPWGYRENEVLDGWDPYSNSKSCSELVTACYQRSFYEEAGIPLSTARAGNVIGGGDFAKDRIIPDCVRAAMNKEPIIVRNPYSTRPYQHVLDPLYAYLMIAARQAEDKSLAGCYNVGPDDEGCSRTGALVDLFCKAWGEGASWVDQWQHGPHEAAFLKLDCAKLKSVFGWRPRWTIGEAIQRTVDWTQQWAQGKSVRGCMDSQIDAFLETAG